MKSYYIEGTNEAENYNVDCKKSTITALYVF